MENIHGHEHPQLEDARFSERVVAFSIDLLLFIALFVLTIRLFFPGEALATHSKGMSWAWLSIGFFMLYQAYFSCEGRTSLGKSLLGLKVVGLDGEPLGAVAAMARSTLYLLSAMLNLGFIWALFDSHKRTWHDLIVGSRVVLARPRSEDLRMLTLAGAWCAVFALGVVYTWELALAAPYYRAVAVANAQIGLDEVGRLQDIHKELHGSYTTSLVRLANISGQPDLFMKNMHGLFDTRAGGLSMQVTPQSYVIVGQARDRKHTRLALAGPRPSGAGR